jgi:hypothetical protein
MSIEIENRKIESVCIIDDDDDSRSTMELTIEDSHLIPLSQNEKVNNLEEYLLKYVQQNVAIVSDHHLKKKNYFPVNGAEVIYNCYEKKIPSVLVTRYEPHIGEIRKFRKNIPVILNPEEFNPDTLIKSLSICIKEFRGEISDERKPWRTLIRIDDVDSSHIYIVIPAWNPNEIISLNTEDLPRDIQEIISTDLRLHAKVNIDAESGNDLFFLDWELN